MSKGTDDNISRTQVLELFTEEKEKYNSYLQLCTYYGVNPDPIVTASWQAKHQIMTHLLGGKIK